MTERICLKEPIPEIFSAAQTMREAVDRHNAGDRDGAASAFEKANCPIVREWTESIWGIGWAENLQLRIAPDAPATLAKESRIPVRMPNASERAALIARDGYRCRFCAIPVIPDTVRKAVTKAYPEAAPWARHKLGQHAAFQAMWLQYDHVLAHARGGDNSLDNVLITCAPCNFAKFNYTLDELGLIDPRSRPIAKSDWNGLVDFLA